MSRPPDKQVEALRLSQKTLHSQLCYRFLKDYGFQNGEMIVPLIVDDIIGLVDQYYSSEAKELPTQILYTAAHVDAIPDRGKTIAATAMQPIRLTMLGADDTQRYAEGPEALLTARIVRWVNEAHAQDALLTTADLALLCARPRRHVDKCIREHERASGKHLPLRGTVHDSSPKLTHKAQILRLYLEGNLPTEIARLTDHSLEAVERYVQRFEQVRILSGEHNAITISRMLDCGVGLVEQYLQLLEETRPATETP